MDNKWNAYADAELAFEPTASGRLNGKKFAIKDVFDIEGHVSGAGNPDWARTHKPAVRHAAVIERLLGSGARLEGAAMTDELMYSINGENAHYGTPVNPRAEGRIPGGSSSGSAVAVAAGLANFAIGTDTGGSVRVPASYCGLFGIRTTHGAVDAAGLIPLAPSFDTIGWMARDAATMLEVGRVLLDSGEYGQPVPPFGRLIAPTDMWAETDGHTSQVLAACLSSLKGQFEHMSEEAVSSSSLAEWAAAFRTIQGYEIWKQHGEWIEAVNPAFGPGIAERFQWARSIPAEDRDAALDVLKAARARMDELLGGDGLLVCPTVPGIAPLRGLSGAEVEETRGRTFRICCAAGLAGLPQVTVPVIGQDGCPIGLSFIAARNADMRLLHWIADQYGY